MSKDGERSFASLTSYIGRINTIIFEKNKRVTSIAAFIIVPILTFAVFSWESNDKADLILGSDSIYEIISGEGQDDFDPSFLKEYDDQVSVSSADGHLSEGSSFDLIVEASDTRLIRKIDVSLDWTDEKNPPGIRLRNYENQPDSFRITISHPDGNRTVIGESDSGALSGSIEFTDQDIERLYDMGNFTVTVTLVQAGDWEANFGFGFLSMEDDGNDYSIEINENFLSPKEMDD
ncbi:MAG: hypothetical protein R6V01_02495 [Thermoplasmatota archaeon]